ncbi:caspase domain-containing protein [Humibacillus xanthopallidus]|uniref:caspase family protein n=1 Tax=Humibacillus xanthopallidus TaxID=412689 RepID=UPI003850DDCB
MAKRALLIGINEYALPGANLRGCVNDVHSMASALTDVYGFSPSDITTLLDEEATKTAMMAAISDLVDAAAPGDVLYLHYSGHGSNVPDSNGDEVTDDRDEILCPHDLDWNDPLTDDWLRTTFDRLDPGASLTVVMDCCHSGSNTREPPRPGAPEPEVISRFLPNPHDERSGGSFTGAPRRRRRRGASDVHDVDLVETLLTGCRDDQTSADAHIDGAFAGALTHYLVRAMRDEPDATYRRLHAKTLAGLRNAYEQVPQLEGRSARLDEAFLSPTA